MKEFREKHKEFVMHSYEPIFEESDEDPDEPIVEGERSLIVRKVTDVDFGKCKNV